MSSLIRPEWKKYVEQNLQLGKVHANIHAFFQFEKVPTAPNWLKSNRLMAKKMKENGLRRVESIPFPLDGKTAYGDLIMPPAWDCTNGFVEIVHKGGKRERLTGFKEHPLCVAMFSPSLKATTAEVTPEESVKNPQDARGKIILIPAGKNLRTAYARFKGSGIVAFVQCGGGTNAYPNDLHWENGWTDHSGWYPHSTPVEFPCLNINWKSYRKLNALLKKGSIRLRVCVKSRTYKGKTEVATGVVPGRTKNEFVCLAHMCEPFLSDDCAGSAALLEIGRMLNAMVKNGIMAKPERSLRCMAGWEMYGFNAVYQSRPALLKHTFAGANLDATGFSPLITTGSPRFHMSFPGLPSFWDAFFFGVMEDRLLKHRVYPSLVPAYSDLTNDNFFSAFGFDFPTYWLSPVGAKVHHMETQATHTAVDMTAMRAILEAWCMAIPVALNAGDAEVSQMAEMGVQFAIANLSSVMRKALGGSTEITNRYWWIDQVEFLRKIEIDRLDGAASFCGNGRAMRRWIAEQKELINHVWKANRKRLGGVPVRIPARTDEQRAANIVPTRKRLGLIHCLARVPAKMRTREMGMGAGYLAWMDGIRNLAECVDLCYRSNQTPAPEVMFRRVTKAAEQLVPYGYLDLKYRKSITQPGLKTMLRRIGIRAGHTVFAHSSLTAFGSLEGGPQAAVTALCESVGKTGTVAMPAFTLLDTIEMAGTRKGKGRIFDPGTSPTPTGAIAEAFRTRAGTLRSAHPTHSVAARGKWAGYLVEGHDETRTPFWWEGPWERLVGLNAWYVFLGAPLGSFSFCHAMEDYFDMPYFQEASGKLKKDGRIHTFTMPGSPLGPRSFYGPAGDRLAGQLTNEAGLKWKHAALPAGDIWAVRMEPMFKSFLRLFEKHGPDLLLRQAECAFSDAARKAMKRKKWAQSFTKRLSPPPPKWLR